MSLYNKYVLEYAQIARSGPKSMIRDTEGPSIDYIILLKFCWNGVCAVK